MFQKKIGNLKKTLKRDWQYWLLLALPLTYLIIFKYYPMLGAQIAFRDYSVRDGIWGSEWVGLKYFIKFFKSYQFTRVVGNTLILSLYYQFVSNIFPIIFALIFNCVEKERLKKVVQTIVTLPHFISTVVLVGILMQILNSRTGLYGIAMEAITGEYPSDIFAKAGNFRHIYTWSGVWQNFGWSSIIYIAALSGVDTNLHEAAQIDGASRLQRVWHIDLPHITPTIVILMLMDLGKIMTVGFEKVFLLQNNLNRSTSELISTYVYEIGLVQSNYSYSTAIGLFNSVINLILVLTMNAVARRVSETSLF
ncbi:MAG: sugar ABC transporter permease [Lachnospiraceae bacterium]|nr:sugar ABC transporter permease [Lachnospiraceae bacterium]